MPKLSTLNTYFECQYNAYVSILNHLCALMKSSCYNKNKNQIAPHYEHLHNLHFAGSIVYMRLKTCAVFRLFVSNQNLNRPCLPGPSLCKKILIHLQKCIFILKSNKKKSLITSIVRLNSLFFIIHIVNSEEFVTN